MRIFCGVFTLLYWFLQDSEKENCDETQVVILWGIAMWLFFG